MQTIIILYMYSGESLRFAVAAWKEKNSSSDGLGGFHGSDLCLIVQYMLKMTLHANKTTLALLE